MIFELIYFSLLENIKKIVDNIDGDIILITGSGTLALEASVINLLKINTSTKQKNYPFIISAGKFGTRFHEIMDAFNIEHVFLNFENERDINYLKIENTIEHYIKKGVKISHIFFQATETSTGIKFNLEFAKYLKEKYDLILCCDAISHILSEEFSQSKFDIDCVILASQKGFSSPAGVSFVSLNKKLSDYFLKNEIKKGLYYYNFSKYIKSPPPFTPAVNTIYALNSITSKIIQIGINKIIEKNKISAKIIRDFLKKSGFTIYPLTPSNSVTVFLIDNANKIIENLENKFNIYVAKGQGFLQNKVIRIGHLGMTPLKFYKKFIKSFIKLI